MIKEAQRLFPNAIEFHFNAPIQKVDLHRRLIYHGPPSEPDATQVPYDLLVGADGAGSVVRSALQRVMPARYMRRYTHKQVYSMGQVAPCSPEEIPPHSVIQAHAAKEGMVIWDAQGSNDCRVGLVLPKERAAALRKGDTEGVVKMLEASAPALPHYARQAVLELAQSKPSFYPMPSWTHLSQLHGPKTVLLGDAAHTMSPVLGQGLNAALEDVGVFAQCLEQHQSNVDAALPAYNKARLPDVQAIMLVNEMVASSDAGLTVQDQDLAHKLWVTGHKLLFKLHMISHTILNKAAPSMIPGPQLIKLVTGAAPYRAFISALYQDAIFTAGLLIAAVALVLYMV